MQVTVSHIPHHSSRTSLHLTTPFTSLFPPHFPPTHPSPYTYHLPLSSLKHPHFSPHPIHPYLTPHIYPRVVTLRMSPLDDMFISGSMDHTLRMWDLRTMASQGTMHVGGRPIATFDPEGLIFATGVNSESLKLFDLRSYENVGFVVYLDRFTSLRYCVQLLHTCNICNIPTSLVYQVVVYFSNY